MNTTDKLDRFAGRFFIYMVSGIGAAMLALGVWLFVEGMAFAGAASLLVVAICVFAVFVIVWTGRPLKTSIARRDTTPR